MITAIADYKNLSIGLTVTKVALATQNAANAIASATTERRWAPRVTVSIWLITFLPDASSIVWYADTCSLIQSATASPREWERCCTSLSDLTSSSLPLAHDGKDQVATKFTNTTQRCSWGIYRVRIELIHCAFRVVPKHVDHGRGNTPLNVTLLHSAYRPSDNSAFLAVGMRIYFAVSCRPLHRVARSSAITTKLLSILPREHQASCSRHSLHWPLLQPRLKEYGIDHSVSTSAVLFYWASKPITTT